MLFSMKQQEEIIDLLEKGKIKTMPQLIRYFQEQSLTEITARDR